MKISKVLSCSSSSSENPVSNLIDEKPWACRKGEKEASVVVLLEGSIGIDSLEIANNGSSSIKIEVANSSQDTFYPFLSKTNFKDTFDVKTVSKIDFYQDTRSKQWIVLKFLCYHESEKNNGFGLSYIRINQSSISEKGEDTGDKMIGQFKLRKDVGLSPKKQPNLFLMKKYENPQQSDSNSIKNFREESKQLLEKELTESSKSSHSNSLQSKKKLFDDSNDDNPIQRAYQNSLATAPKLTYDDVPSKRPSSPPLLELSRKKNRIDNDNNNSNNNHNSNQSKPYQSNSNQNPPNFDKNKPDSLKNTDDRVKTPFNQLMSKFTISISGIVNPKRTEIREQLIEMGASYSPDVGPETTHVICPFSNSPKLQEIKRKGGKVVKPEWVNDCYKQKRLIPEARYSHDDEPKKLSPIKSGGFLRDDDLIQKAIEESLKTPSHDMYVQKALQDSVNQQSKPSDNRFHQKALSDDDDDIPVVPRRNNNNFDNSKNSNNSNTFPSKSNFSSNTISQSNPQNKNSNYTSNSNSNSNPNPNLKNLSNNSAKSPFFSNPKDYEDEGELPSFLLSCRIHMYQLNNPDLEKKLIRYIAAYNGAAEKFPTGNVTHIIATKWNPAFDGFLKMNPKIFIVTPDWLLDCHKQQKRIQERTHFVKKVPSLFSIF